LIVSFLAGLGFDFAIEQLLKRAKESGDRLPAFPPVKD